MKNKLIILKIIGIILLSISFLDLDYFFYQILRWYIFSLSGYLAYTYYQTKKEKWIWIFAIIAIAFNPIAPIYFGKEIWMVLDGITIMIMIYNLYIEKD